MLYNGAGIPLSLPILFVAAGSSSANSSLTRKRGSALSTSLASDSSKKICARLEEPIRMASPLPIDTVNNTSLAAKEDVRIGVASRVYSFFDDLTATIVTYYAELCPRAGYICFGATNDTVPAKIRLTKCNMARDPWVIGSVPPGPAPAALRAIKDWFAGASELTLERSAHFRTLPSSAHAICTTCALSQEAQMLSPTPLSEPGL